jgi:hypothetical protein
MILNLLKLVLHCLQNGPDISSGLTLSINQLCSIDSFLKCRC